MRTYMASRTSLEQGVAESMRSKSKSPNRGPASRKEKQNEKRKIMKGETGGGACGSPGIPAASSDSRRRNAAGEEGVPAGDVPVAEERDTQGDTLEQRKRT